MRNTRSFRNFFPLLLCSIVLTMIVSDGYAAASKKQTPKIDMNTKVIDAYSVAVDIKTNLPDGTLLMVYMRFADDTVGIPSVSISSDGSALKCL